MVNQNPQESKVDDEGYPDFPIELMKPYKPRFRHNKKFQPAHRKRKDKVPSHPREEEHELSGENLRRDMVHLRLYPPSQTVKEGQDAVLQCRDEGPLRLEVRWRRAGLRRLPSGSSEGRGRLEILGTRPGDAGEYECFIENSYLTVTATASLVVEEERM